MAIQLPPEIEASIYQLVERGRFPDATGVVREAMRLLDEHEHQLDDVRAKILGGVEEAERGETDEWTPELRDRLRREALEMVQRGEVPDTDVWP